MFEMGVHTTCFTLGLNFFKIDYSSIKYHVYQLKNIYKSNFYNLFKWNKSILKGYWFYFNFLT